MKRRLIKNCLTFALLISFLFSCKKEEDTTTPAPTGASISGKAQKGPFKSGSDVVITELSSTLQPTENSYSTTVSDDAGSFSFNDINVSTGYASLTATGYYYMEHFNKKSQYRLYLEAVGDVEGGSIINVNLLTHLIKPRIEKLVADGNSFSSARTQAQNELKTFFHAPSSGNTNFEDMTVTGNNLCFAASLLFQRRVVYTFNPYNFTNELIHLLINFRSDFRDNGQIDSQDIIDTLIYNANKIELIDCKANLKAYMSSIGGTTSLTGYEEYIYAFQKAYSPQVFTSCFFPDSIIWDIDNNNPSQMRNILQDTSVYFQALKVYAMSAIVPCDTSLVIKFTLLSQDTNAYSAGFYIYGWSRSLFSYGFSLEAQRKNYPNGYWLNLAGTPGANSALIEYFMNNQPVAYFSKIIYW